MYLILIVFSTIAVCMSSFMMVYILFLSKGLNQKKIALVLLMLALTIRILKSVFYFLIYPKLSIWFLMMGFIGFSMIGPFAYSYFTLKTEYDATKAIVVRWTDFIFPVGGVLALYLYPSYAEVLYFLSLMSMGIYLVLGYGSFYHQKVKKKNTPRNWNDRLFIALSVLFAAFLLPYIIRFPLSYAIGTVIASVTIFVLFFYFLKDAPRLGKNGTKHKIRDKQRELVVSALEIDAVYRNPSIDLNIFSSKLDIPRHIIIQVIKDRYGKSFHGTINNLRIKDAKQRLRAKVNDSKIETLAYDVGFNTVSAFYAVFKKETSMSPREYQRLTEQED